MIERKQFYVVKCGGKNCREELEFYKEVYSIEGVRRVLIDEFYWKRRGKKWLCPDCQKGKK